MKSLKLYHHGAPGAYDEYHPIYVHSMEYVPEILYIIAKNEPFTLSEKDILEILNIDSKVCQKAIKALEKINAISNVNNKYKINFQTFLEEDVILLQGINKLLSEKLGRKIIEIKDRIIEKVSKLKHYDKNDLDVLLYHIIACHTLDWAGIDFFADKGMINTGREQPGNRNYLLIGYEESEKVQEYSDKLFCCSNNTRSENIRFSSFGDDEGLRMKGMRGVLISAQRNLLHSSKYEEVGLAYNALIQTFNNSLVKRLGELLLKMVNEDTCYKQYSDEDKLMIDMLKAMEYIKFQNESSKINVIIPVFEQEDKVIFDEVAHMVLSHISVDVENSFKHIVKTLPQLTSVKHGVSIEDMSNEIWHQIFGGINEYLMESGFIAKPPYREGEGHYLKTLYVD